MKKIKGLLVCILVICMIAGCLGCSSSDESGKKDDTTQSDTTQTDSKTEKKAEKKTDKAEDNKADETKKEEKADDTSADDTKNAVTDDTEAEPEDEPEDESFEPVVFSNGVYLNEDGIYCNPDGTTYDLGGMEIYIADWFSKDSTEPETSYQEATEEYRNEIQELYNFTIKPLKISGYGTYQENFSNFATSGGPENYVFCMANQFLTVPMLSGLLYDLSTLDILDFSEEKWNESMTHMTQMGDAIYGMRAEATEPRGGVFWNKRLFEELGIDPELPYDLQASGNWTWETFEDLCKQLTKDIDNDGIADYWAMTSFSGDLLNSTIASNGAQIIERDENGKFYLATGSEEFMEAYDWIKYMRENYEMPSKSNNGENWDYSYYSFNDAEAAMIVAEEYQAANFNEKMQDDFGFVMFPHGPKVDDLTGYSTDNTYVIPSVYDADRAWKIAFAYNLYTEPTPMYDDAEDWKMSYYPIFRDERAVDETLELMRTHQVALIHPLVPKINTDNEYYWNIDIETAAERYEIKKDEYQSYIDAIQN